MDTYIFRQTSGDTTRLVIVQATSPTKAMARARRDYGLDLTGWPMPLAYGTRTSRVVLELEITGSVETLYAEGLEGRWSKK